MAASRPAEAPRPAFYALARGGWRDYVTLLHLPYTAWHLGYVTIGAALAAPFDLVRWGATMAAFFLAVGVGAHALDELQGRPLDTTIPARHLKLAAAVSIAGAVAIGILASLYISLWLLVFVAAGALLVVAYNLELWQGRLHSDSWFALSWGGFPVLCGYFAQAESLSGDALLAAAFATALSLAQRRLSSAVRHLRRRVTRLSGELETLDGERHAISRATLTGPSELALRLMSVSVVLLALALLVRRLA